MERKGGMTHGRRKSGGSPSKWQPLSSSLQSPSWTLHSLHSGAAQRLVSILAYVRTLLDFIYLYLHVAIWPLFSVTTTHHFSGLPLVGIRQLYLAALHSPSSRIGPPKQTFLNSPSTSALTVRCTPSQSDHQIIRSSTAAEECSSGVTSRQKRHEKLATSASFLPARFCDVLTIGSPTPAICPPALHSA